MDLQRIISEHLPDSFSILGHSYGAALAARFAGLFPERINTLICLEGFSGRKSESEELKKIRDWLTGYIDKSYNIKWMKKETLLKILAGLYPHHEKKNLEHISHYLTIKTEQGYKWKYDPYLKNTFPMPFPPQLSRKLWQNIKAPTLIAMGKMSHLYPDHIAEIIHHFNNVTSGRYLRPVIISTMITRTF